MMRETSFPLSPTGLFVVAAWLFISLCIIARLWVTRRADPIGRKLVWSVIVLLLPMLGWLFYAAFYQAPKPLYDGDHYESGLG